MLVASPLTATVSKNSSSASNRNAIMSQHRPMSKSVSPSIPSRRIRRGMTLGTAVLTRSLSVKDIGYYSPPILTPSSPGILPPVPPIPEGLRINTAKNQTKGSSTHDLPEKIDDVTTPPAIRAESTHNDSSCTSKDATPRQNKSHKKAAPKPAVQSSALKSEVPLATTEEPKEKKSLTREERLDLILENLTGKGTCVKKGYLRSLYTPKLSLSFGLAKEEAVELYYELHGNGPKKIIFIMGMICTSIYWQLQINHFASLPEYQVCIFDNRGTGRSSAFIGSLSISQMAQDTLNLLDHLGWKENVHVVGVSMGGMIAQKMCTMTEDTYATQVSPKPTEDLDSTEIDANANAGDEDSDNEESDHDADTNVPYTPISATTPMIFDFADLENTRNRRSWTPPRFASIVIVDSWHTASLAFPTAKEIKFFFNILSALRRDPRPLLDLAFPKKWVSQEFNQSILGPKICPESIIDEKDPISIYNVMEVLFTHFEALASGLSDIADPIEAKLATPDHAISEPKKRKGSDPTLRTNMFTNVKLLVRKTKTYYNSSHDDRPASPIQRASSEPIMALPRTTLNSVSEDTDTLEKDALPTPHESSLSNDIADGSHISFDGEDLNSSHMQLRSESKSHHRHGSFKKLLGGGWIKSLFHSHGHHQNEKDRSGAEDTKKTRTLTFSQRRQGQKHKRTKSDGVKNSKVTGSKDDSNKPYKSDPADIDQFLACFCHRLDAKTVRSLPLRHPRTRFLVIHGRKDRVIRPMCGKIMARLLRCPMVWIEDSGHMPLIDASRSFNAILQGWVEQEPWLMCAPDKTCILAEKRTTPTPQQASKSGPPGMGYPRKDSKDSVKPAHIAPIEAKLPLTFDEATDMYKMATSLKPGNLVKPRRPSVATTKSSSTLIGNNNTYHSTNAYCEWHGETLGLNIDKDIKIRLYHLQHEKASSSAPSTFTSTTAESIRHKQERRSSFWQSSFSILRPSTARNNGSSSGSNYSSANSTMVNSASIETPPVPLTNDRAYPPALYQKRKSSFPRLAMLKT
ncbi:hypothetical protein H4219_000465 [Mycoemilia scoparia]|uniref:AB hydrolase-1 domain-containing protein n=1 Tax=Mycoemilia scoparia TaxID=417184 RepID=A0A9W8DWY9_9FUNG|nr:hypothetical protein H4219_000465 [Mycoemilia scoparia]